MAANTTTPKETWRIATDGEQKDILGIPPGYQFRLYKKYIEEAKKEESKAKIREINKVWEQKRKGGKTKSSSKKTTSFSDNTKPVDGKLVKGAKIPWQTADGIRRDEYDNRGPPTNIGDPNGEVISPYEGNNKHQSRPLNLQRTSSINGTNQHTNTKSYTDPDRVDEK